MKMVFLLLSLAIGFTSQAVAQDKSPKTKQFSTSANKLPKDMQNRILSILKERGIKIKNLASAQASASTKNCPSICNDSVGGGFCYCEPSGGKCPMGTTKTGVPGKEQCKVQIPKISVEINGVPEPVVVQMP